MHNTESNLCIFSSLVSGIKSPVHDDITDVLLLGLHGKVLYKINNTEEYILEPSDLLIIPKGTKHMAIGIDPRITLSYGIFPQIEKE
jgi:quercetin dioxygenase-like cupin family protein